MDDISDTDFKCRTSVSAFTLKTDAIKRLMNKHPNLKNTVHSLMKKLHGKEIALDYIIHNNAKTAEEYEAQLRRNQLRVKFKDAIMRLWSKYKEDHKKPSLNYLVKKMMKEKKDREFKGVETEEQERERLRNEEKLKNRAERKAQDKKKLEAEAANSYLKIEQF